MTLWTPVILHDNYRVPQKKLSFSKSGFGKYRCILTEIQSKLFDKSKNESSPHYFLAGRCQCIWRLIGFGHIKSTYDPLLVMITCGRLWTPIVICTWAEFTLLMMPNIENFLGNAHISNCIQSANPCSRKLGGKFCQLLGQEVLVAPSLVELHCQEDSLMQIRLQNQYHAARKTAKILTVL